MGFYLLEHLRFNFTYSMFAQRLVELDSVHASSAMYTIENERCAVAFLMSHEWINLNQGQSDEKRSNDLLLD